MPQINCNETTCDYNKVHPSGKGRTCIIDILSIIEGQCEYLQVKKVSQELDAKERLDNIQSELRNPEYFENLQRNRDARNGE